MLIKLRRLDDDYHLEATNDTGNTLETDGSQDIGGHGRAMRPMQTVLAALGSCSAIDVIMFLRKMRQPLEDIEIEVKADREADKTPSLFTRIYVHYRLTGDISEKKAEKAIRMSMETYCSVAKMLEKAAPIEWSYVIVGADKKS
ncbi:MAG: OsmC family protein [Saprospiraceae bacterium]|nr:OsmC family protein [Saprospiraceae bacterium]